jgi:hypothetical protein
MVVIGKRAVLDQQHCKFRCDLPLDRYFTEQILSLCEQLLEFWIKILDYIFWYCHFIGKVSLKATGNFVVNLTNTNSFFLVFIKEIV